MGLFGEMKVLIQISSWYKSTTLHMLKLFQRMEHACTPNQSLERRNSDRRILSKLWSKTINVEVCQSHHPALLLLGNPALLLKLTSNRLTL